eukprot:632502_1
MLNFEVDGLFGVVDDVNILSKLLEALVDSIGIYLNSFKIGFAYGCCSYPGSYVSRADWRYIFSKCPHLQRIRLKEAHTVDDSVLNSISRYCPKATELEIIGNKPTRYEDRSGCEQCEGRIRCQDSYILFHSINQMVPLKINPLHGALSTVSNKYLLVYGNIENILKTKINKKNGQTLMILIYPFYQIISMGYYFKAMKAMMSFTSSGIAIGYL